MEKYEVLSSSVIKNDNLLFTRVSSAQCIERKLYEQDASYELDVENIDIQMKDNKSTSGIRFTFGFEKCNESENSSSMYYVDLLISDVLGTFISDWYWCELFNVKKKGNKNMNLEVITIEDCLQLEKVGKSVVIRAGHITEVKEDK